MSDRRKSSNDTIRNNDNNHRNSPVIRSAHEPGTIGRGGAIDAFNGERSINFATSSEQSLQNLEKVKEYMGKKEDGWNKQKRAGFIKNLQYVTGMKDLRERNSYLGSKSDSHETPFANPFRQIEQGTDGKSTRIAQVQEFSQNLTTLFSSKLDKSNTSISAALWGAMEKARDEIISALQQKYIEVVKYHYEQADRQYQEKMNEYRRYRGKEIEVKKELAAANSQLSGQDQYNDNYQFVRETLIPYWENILKMVKNGEPSERKPGADEQKILAVLENPTLSLRDNPTLLDGIEAFPVIQEKLAKIVLEDLKENFVAVYSQPEYDLLANLPPKELGEKTSRMDPVEDRAIIDVMRSNPNQTVNTTIEVLFSKIIISELKCKKIINEKQHAEVKFFDAVSELPLAQNTQEFQKRMQYLYHSLACVRQAKNELFFNNFIGQIPELMSEERINSPEMKAHQFFCAYEGLKQQKIKADKQGDAHLSGQIQSRINEYQEIINLGMMTTEEELANFRQANGRDIQLDMEFHSQCFDHLKEPDQACYENWANSDLARLLAMRAFELGASKYSVFHLHREAFSLVMDKNNDQRKKAWAYLATFLKGDPEVKDQFPELDDYLDKCLPEVNAESRARLQRFFQPKATELPVQQQRRQIMQKAFAKRWSKEAAPFQADFLRKRKTDGDYGKGKKCPEKVEGKADPFKEQLHFAELAYLKQEEQRYLGDLQPDRQQVVETMVEKFSSKGNEYELLKRVGKFVFSAAKKDSSLISLSDFVGDVYLNVKCGNLKEAAKNLDEALKLMEILEMRSLVENTKELTDLYGYFKETGYSSLYKNLGQDKQKIYIQAIKDIKSPIISIYSKIVDEAKDHSELLPIRWGVQSVSTAPAEAGAGFLYSLVEGHLKNPTIVSALEKVPEFKILLDLPQRVE